MPFSLALQNLVSKPLQTSEVIRAIVLEDSPY